MREARRPLGGVLGLPVGGSLLTARSLVIGLTVLWSAFVIVPLGGLVLYSIFRVEDFTLVFEPTSKSYVDLYYSGRWSVILRTLRIAATVTLIEFVIAFPFALWLAKGLKSVPVKVAILTLVVIPFFLSNSARTIVWRPLLGNNGLINTFLIEAGLIDQPLDWLLFSEFSVHFGLIAPFFPTMLIPLFLAITLIDDDYLEASADLGASSLQRLWTVILPLALPGIVAGVVFTIVPMLGEMVVPQLMGGGRFNLVGKSVESALQALNYGVAAAMCTFILVVLVASVFVMNAIMQRGGGLGATFAVMKR